MKVESIISLHTKHLNKIYLYNEHYENSIKERVFFGFFNDALVMMNINVVNEYLELANINLYSRYYQDE